jgi:hypothetical protein
MSSDPLEDPAVPSAVSPIQPPSAAEWDDPAPGLEVVILWGDAVLHVSHLAPVRAFYVGEDAPDTPPVDYVIGRASLGVERLPIVLDADGGYCVVFGAGADGEVMLSDQTRSSLDELARHAQLTALAGLPGARQYRLPRGAAACVRHAGFTFLVKPTALAPWLELRQRDFSLRHHGWTLCSTSLHLLALAAFYFMPPQSSALSIERLAEDQRWVGYAVDPPARDADLPNWMVEHQGAADGGSSRAADGPSGKLGDARSKPAPHHFAVKGRFQQREPQSRAPAADLARQLGIIGVLNAVSNAAPAPSSLFARAQAEGNDPEDALGGLLGAIAGADAGNGGLGPIGTGHGGGGVAVGTVGSGPLDTRGRGGLGGNGRGPGYGSAAGGLGERTSRVPRIISQKAEVRGSLSKELIRRIVGQHLHEVRGCYEQALIGRPDLEGRVAIRFVISASGAVQMAVLDSSELADARVGLCIAASVRRWTFPAPEGGGLVVVTYPFLLSQTGR